MGRDEKLPEYRSRAVRSRKTKREDGTEIQVRTRKVRTVGDAFQAVEDIIDNAVIETEAALRRIRVPAETKGTCLPEVGFTRTPVPESPLASEHSIHGITPNTELKTGNSIVAMESKVTTSGLLARPIVSESMNHSSDEVSPRPLWSAPDCTASVDKSSSHTSGLSTPTKTTSNSESSHLNFPSSYGEWLQVLTPTSGSSVSGNELNGLNHPLEPSSSGRRLKTGHGSVISSTNKSSKTVSNYSNKSPSSSSSTKNVKKSKCPKLRPYIPSPTPETFYPGKENIVYLRDKEKVYKSLDDKTLYFVREVPNNGAFVIDKRKEARALIKQMNKSANKSLKHKSEQRCKAESVTKEESSPSNVQEKGSAPAERLSCRVDPDAKSDSCRGERVSRQSSPDAKSALRTNSATSTEHGTVTDKNSNKEEDNISCFGFDTSIIIQDPKFPGMRHTLKISGVCPNFKPITICVNDLIVSNNNRY